MTRRMTRTKTKRTVSLICGRHEDIVGFFTRRVHNRKMALSVVSCNLTSGCFFSAAGDSSGESDTTRIRLTDCTRYGCKLELFHEKKVQPALHRTATNL